MRVLRIGGPWWIRWGILSMIVAGIGCAIAVATSGTDCAATRSAVDPALPNPLRAIVSEELSTWRNWLENGSFEDLNRPLQYLQHPVSSLTEGGVMWTGEAARTRSRGLRIENGPDEGVFFGIRSKVEKGERIRCTLWARSNRGPASLRVSMLGVVRGESGPPRTLYRPEPFHIDESWTQIRFTFANTQAVEYALLAVDAGPNMAIDIDDAAIEAEQWAPAQPNRCSRTVGGITVPLEPVAPVHFNVLIHIEDPALITQQEGYFLEKTAVFSELARVLHEHGGFLTIQPEEDWPMAALKFAPDTLARLATDYGVVYSTHTHGPACIDADGRLRSNQDCNSCRTCPGWRSVETDTDPYTPEYVRNLRELIEQASGTPVSDHNGNFHYGNTVALAEAGVRTWSAFKNHNTQATFDALYTNPWRPTACDAIESPEVFQTHDPSTPVIYVPGWGQAVTRHPERLHERLAGMLSQVLAYADPERVNTFYIVTHVDHYRAEDGEPYIETDPSSGEVTLHEAFLRDLGAWEETLSELIDPLVEAGYIAWTPLAEIGELFVSWEEAVR